MNGMIMVFSAYKHEQQNFEISPKMNAQFALNKELMFHLQIPYLVKLGFVDPKPEPGVADLPGYDFEVNPGFGDFTGGFSWLTTIYEPAPMNITAQFDVVAPIGKSRFDDSYEGYLPLGNGFWTLSFGTGINKGLSSKFLLYTNWGYINRFSRTFKIPTPSNNNVFTEQVLDPDAIMLFRGGLGFIGIGGGIIGFEYERVSVGAIKRVQGEYTGIREGGYNYTRLGVKIVATNKAKLPPSSLFIGFEDSFEQTIFIASLNLLNGINIFGFDF